jgi:hypothetical protein
VKLYEAYVHDVMFSEKGIGWDVVEGEAISVHGIQMVRMAHGTIVPATKWRTSKAEVIVAAADRVEALGRQMLDQAQRMRSEATVLREEKS